eukprot:TRINITY_DN62176_c0_g1_i1.p1 TRINITY_DN62176_c0_g1~~TRINITY_DN62176_c0_g1_i1.p1  ORF type:complete len:883 (-),score=121.76 TRINITY_DN62176_c0_g1_i1:124-2772(-)
MFTTSAVSGRMQPTLREQSCPVGIVEEFPSVVAATSAADSRFDGGTSSSVSALQDLPGFSHSFDSSSCSGFVTRSDSSHSTENARCESTVSEDEFLFDSAAYKNAKRRRRLIQVAAIVLIGLLGSVPMLVSARRGHGLAYWPMYLCYAFVVVLVVAYPSLRWGGYIGVEALGPACVLGAWLVCLLICFGPPSRQRQLFGTPDGKEVVTSDIEFFCEEGTTAMWLALVLFAVSAFVPTRSGHIVGLSVIVILQYLFLGLALPRPECNRGGLSIAPMLWLPPIWASVVQITAMAGAFALVRNRVDSTRKVEHALLEFIEGHYKERDLKRKDRNNLVLHGCIEKLLENIETEERDCRSFLHKVHSVMPPGTSDHMWSAAVGCLILVISSWRGMLASEACLAHGKTKEAEIAARVREMSSAHEVDTNMQAVSLYVGMSQTYSTGESADKKKRAASAERVESQDASFKRHALPLVTMPGLTDELFLGTWEFDALAVNRENLNCLQVVGFELLRRFHFLPRDQLSAFLSKLEASYVAENPYHSHVHAADVCNAIFFLASNTKLWCSEDVCDFRSAAMILAAAGHDVGHPGRNNTFLIASQHELAITYNDRSVLEHFHAATLMRLIRDPHKQSTLLAQLQVEEVKVIRQLMITLILATDTQKHLEELATFRIRIGAEAFDPYSEENDKVQSLAMLFRAADINHSSKRWTLHVEWSTRVVQEFHAQGDEEKKSGLQISPLCSREGFKLAASQVGFLQFVCLPTWKEIARFEEKLFNLLRSPSLMSPTAEKMNSGRGNSPSSRGERCPSRNALSISKAVRRPSHAAFGFFPVGPQTHSPLPFVLSDMTEPATAPRRSSSRHMSVLTDTCLRQCEANFQAWKQQAASERIDQ